jgi:hypothetical protein
MGMDGQQPNQPHKSDPSDDDFRAASQSAAEYDEYTKHAKVYTASKHLVRKMLIVFGVLVLLAVIGLGIYWFFLRDSGKKADETKPSTSQSQQTQNEAKLEISTKTEHYVATNFSLEFDYPDDWKVTEENGSGQLTVRSPTLRLTSASGAAMMGRITFKVRDKQQALPEFDKGNAVAARESEKIAYAKPSSVQRGSTYLSFLQYASSTAKGIDGVYITGDTGYQEAQAIPKADFTPVDPVISATFEKCANSTCSSQATAAGVATSLWQDAAFSKPLKAFFQSLAIN